MTNKTITLDHAVAERMSKAIEQDKLFKYNDLQALHAAIAHPVPPSCCTVTAEEQALLDSGEYQPEELFGVGGKPSCPKCHGKPVPPAGGEPEALVTDAAKAMQAAHISCPLQLSGMDRMAWIADHFQRWYVCSTKPSITDALQKRIKELVGIHGSLRAVARHTGIDVGYLSRLDSGERDNPSVEVLSMLGVAVLDNGAHVTRLQAELAQKTEALDVAKGMLQARVKQCAALQPELTKALELLADVAKTPWMYDVLGSVREYVSSQSAPALIETLRANGDRIAMEAIIAQQAQRIADLEADKGQGEPLIHITPEVLAMLRGERKMMAGGLTYSQSKPVGNWTVPLYAEQPAPVAVVMPSRDRLRDLIAQAIGGDTYDCVRVWSAWGVGTMSEDDFVPVVEQESRLYEIADACLDEVARLNPIKQ